MGVIARHPNAPDDDEIDAIAERDREPDPWKESLAKALADIKAALTATVDTEREPLFLDVREVLEREHPAPAWQVVGLVTRGGTVVIAGEPKAATKTWVGTDLAVATATGTPVFGEFTATQGSVAYFYAEDTDRQVRNRVRALVAGRGVDAAGVHGRLFVRPRGKFLDVTRDEDLAWIVASVRRVGSIDLLVLDPLRDISSAAEDKSDEMAPVMRRLRLLGVLLGCTVAVVHHAAKLTETTGKRRPGQRMRGSSAIHGSVDSGIYLSESDGDGTTTFRNMVEVEIKGARSAGRFKLELSIQDDAGDEAVVASWTVSRPSKASEKQTAAAADDDKVFAFVRDLATRGVRMSRRALREHDESPLPDRRMRAALDRVIEAGRLVLDGLKVIVPGSKVE